MANKNLPVLAVAKIKLEHGEDGSFNLSGDVEAHHGTILGSQKGETLVLTGKLSSPDLGGQDISVEIRLGNISVRGRLQLGDVTVEQVLFLLGQPMPAAHLAGAA